jgi:hypothetical protein
MPLVSLYDKVILDDKCIFTTSPELNSLVFNLELSIAKGMRLLEADSNTWVTIGNNVSMYSLDNGNTWSTPIDFGAGTEAPYGLATNGNGFWVFLESSSSTQPYNVFTTSNILTGWTSSVLNPSLTAGTSFTATIYSSYYDRYVAVSTFVHTDNGNLVGAYSTDGLNWLSSGYIGTPPGAGYNDLIEGTYMPNHRIVGCGGGGFTKFGYSDDGGLTWNRGTWPTTGTNTLQSQHSWNNIVYGYDGGAVLPLSGRFVAANGLNTATAYNQFAYSDDGINWTGVKVNGLSGINAIAYGKGMFIALTNVVSNSMNALTSTNGINWGLYTLPLSAPGGWAEAHYANDRFIIESTWTGTQNAVIMSADWPGWINTNY